MNSEKVIPYDRDHMDEDAKAKAVRYSEPNWGGYFHSSVLTALPSANRRGARVMDVPTATLFARDDRPVAMFYVLSGEVQLVRRSRSGGEMLVQRTRLGFLAETQSLRTFLRLRRDYHGNIPGALNREEAVFRLSDV